VSLAFLVESTKEIKAINYYLNANKPASDPNWYFTLSISCQW